jgi:hypothetical protein
MFDLDKDVHAWCSSIYSGGWRRASRIDELKDHLYCEVERLSEKGLSDEQAFRVATERAGNVEDLRTEAAKNRTWLSSFSELLLASFQIPTGGPDMDKRSAGAKRPLLPTFTSAIGMSLGGLLGAVGGLLAGTEWSASTRDLLQAQLPVAFWAGDGLLAEIATSPRLTTPSSDIAPT